MRCDAARVASDAMRRVSSTTPPLLQVIDCARLWAAVGRMTRAKYSLAFCDAKAERESGRPMGCVASPFPP
ncbi:unnamed protein product [Toxocara canis]|uniref:Secreted protein n=1 Tax=Toxocara canis TaxID=6265 RepID=A0A183UUL0_TOXCA|nr:unnamed protein product [Toxocara canis]